MGLSAEGARHEQTSAPAQVPVVQGPRSKPHELGDPDAGESSAAEVIEDAKRRVAKTVLELALGELARESTPPTSPGARALERMLQATTGRAA